MPRPAATVTDLGLCSCACCEKPTELFETISGAQICTTCAPLIHRAFEDGGSILRWRCSPLLIGAPAVCGRVWKVAYQTGMTSPVVSDTSAACPACRPAQRAHVEKTLGPMEWADVGHG
jgi:hypothetical protein